MADALVPDFNPDGKIPDRSDICGRGGFDCSGAPDVTDALVPNDLDSSGTIPRPVGFDDAAGTSVVADVLGPADVDLSGINPARFGRDGAAVSGFSGAFDSSGRSEANVLALDEPDTSLAGVGFVSFSFKLDDLEDSPSIGVIGMLRGVPVVCATLGSDLVSGIPVELDWSSSGIGILLLLVAVALSLDADSDDEKVVILAGAGLGDESLSTGFVAVASAVELAIVWLD